MAHFYTKTGVPVNIERLNCFPDGRPQIQEQIETRKTFKVRLALSEPTEAMWGSPSYIEQIFLTPINDTFDEIRMRKTVSPKGDAQFNLIFERYWLDDSVVTDFIPIDEQTYERHKEDRNGPIVGKLRFRLLEATKRVSSLIIDNEEYTSGLATLRQASEVDLDVLTSPKVGLGVLDLKFDSAEVRDAFLQNMASGSKGDLPFSTRGDISPLRLRSIDLCSGKAGLKDWSISAPEAAMIVDYFRELTLVD